MNKAEIIEQFSLKGVTPCAADNIIMLALKNKFIENEEKIKQLDLPRTEHQNIYSMQKTSVSDASNAQRHHLHKAGLRHSYKPTPHPKEYQQSKLLNQLLSEISEETVSALIQFLLQRDGIYPAEAES